MLRNVTLSAEEALIRRARERARDSRTTLNAAFRSWLSQYAGAGQREFSYAEFVKRFQGVDAGRRFTRDEMNERR